MNWRALIISGVLAAGLSTSFVPTASADHGWSGWNRRHYDQDDGDRDHKWRGRHHHDENCRYDGWSRGRNDDWRWRYGRQYDWPYSRRSDYWRYRQGSNRYGYHR